MWEKEQRKAVKIYKTASRDGSMGPVAQPGWSVRLITGRSWVRIPPGPIKVNTLLENFLVVGGKRGKGLSPAFSFYRIFSPTS